MSIFCRFICSVVLLALCPPLQAMEEVIDKENLNPTFSLMRKKERVEKQNKDLLHASSKETLRLEGPLSEDDILKLKSPRYNIIYLHCAFFKGKHPAFTEGIINVSPATFNRDIEELCLQLCGINSVSLTSIGGFTNLSSLFLPANDINIKAVKKIVVLKSIKFLDLSANRLENDALELISGMPSLIQLDISQNRKIDDEGAKYLVPHATLRKLNIQFTKVTEHICNALRQNDREVKYFPL